jgi:hypothetical protein
MISHPSISAVRLFGSKARGDSDESSDVDMLIVQREKIPKVQRYIIESDLRTLKRNYSICWYSEQTLCRMYVEGHLFAWHLYKESVNVGNSAKDFIDLLGQPNRYTEAVSDIKGFRDILCETNLSLSKSDGNATYEAGIIFVCSRNIAMIASTYLADGPYFGRRSPFQLQSTTGIAFSLSAMEHESNMRARTFAHRGVCVTRNAKDVSGMAERVACWAKLVHEYVAEQETAWEKETQGLSNECTQSGPQFRWSIRDSRRPSP